jgi:hypothetical protein
MSRCRLIADWTHLPRDVGNVEKEKLEMSIEPRPEILTLFPLCSVWRIVS